MSMPAQGEVWVRQDNGRAVLVEEVTDPDPHYDPVSASAWGGRQYHSEQVLKRIRAGSVSITPVAACYDPQCPHDNPKWHRDCPPGFHSVRGRRTSVRLDRWDGQFALLRRAA